MRLDVGDKLLEAAHRKRRMYDDHARLAADERYRREVLDPVVRKIRVERRADRIGLRSEQQRVAVWRSFRDDVGAYRRAGARLVLDDDTLAQPPAESVGDETRRSVDRAAGRKRYHDAHRPRGIGRRLSEGEIDEDEREHGNRAADSPDLRNGHPTLLPRRWYQRRRRNGAGARRTHGAWLHRSGSLR